MSSLSVRPIASTIDMVRGGSAQTHDKRNKSLPKPIPVANLTAASLPFRAAYHAGVCALSSYVFAIITPGPAAVFGAASSVVQDLINPLLGHSYDDASVLVNYFKTVAKSAFVYATAAAIAAQVVKALGVQITFTTSLQLTCAMYVTSCVITGLALACIGCLCCGFLATALSFAPHQVKN